MAAFSQETRLGRLTTSLGADQLVLLRFLGDDLQNGLFEFTVEALSESSDLDFDGLIGTHATVEIDSRSGSVAFDGIVTEACWKGIGESGWRYDLTLRPWMWLCGKRRNQRIFHEKTAPEIISDVLGDYGHLGDPALQMNLENDYPTLEYTVQYGESDLNFLCRLMERFGISYHFRHAPGSHTLVLTDRASAHENIGTFPYRGIRETHREDDEHFWSWSPGRRFTTGAIRLTDFNFKKPLAGMDVDQEGDAAYAEGRIESFDYPGDYLEQEAGRAVVARRVLAERGEDIRLSAEGDCVSLMPGGVVTQDGGDHCPGRGEEFLCLSARYHFVAQGFGSGVSDGEDKPYRAEYELMPVTAPMVPPRQTAAQVVQGPQTAMVVGDGEIDCDEFGRILVQFHWDLDGAQSMRCRVSQSWASKGWGGMVIPRIGMEVVVEFLEGDPDKPLVIGCVYNGHNTAPYALPDHKTRSTFRTDTHQGDGFNELRFEDKSDEEEIFVHAQKDMNMEILNDRTKRVGRDQSEFVGNDKSIEVGGDHDEVISGNLSIAVGKNPLTETLMKKTAAIFNKAGAAMQKMKIPDPFNFAKGNMQMFIEKNKSEVVNGASSEIVGVVKSTVVGHTFQQTVGKAFSLIVRGRSDTDIGKVMNIRVGDQLTIMVGENALLTMSKEGDILIKGKSIKLKADKIDMN